jgi:hypothetical protein
LERALDPPQQLIAATLERRWNDSLLALEELKKQYERFAQREARALTPEQKSKVLTLARDLPRLWNAHHAGSRSQAHAAIADKRHHC